MEKSSSTLPGRRYLLDVAADLPVILLEFNTANDEITKCYVHDYNRPLAQYDGPMPSGEKYFYLCSRLGSVRQVIDTNGSVKHLYTYGPFGKKLESDSDEDDLPNPFRFTGQYFDTETGDYHLRARQYCPVLQRFTTRDPFLGQLEEPATLHAYLYCLNNPINATDPTGQFSIIETESTSAIQSGMDAYGAVDTALDIRGYAQQILQGVSIKNVLYGAGMNLLMDKVGGKFFENMSRGVVRKLNKLDLGKYTFTSHKRGHHLLPQWMGGDPLQLNILLGKEKHDALKKIIRENMKKYGVTIDGRSNIAEKTFDVITLLSR